MDLSASFRLSLSTLFVALGVAALASTGCEPEFSDQQCQSDKDCFPGEVCAVSGICQPSSYYPDVGDDAGDDDDGGTAAVATIEIDPASAELAIGGSLELHASAYDADGNPVDTALFTWDALDSEIVDIDDRGVATGVALGTTTISAQSVTNPDIEGFAEITVVEGTAESVQVEPDPATLFVGETKTFTATGFNEGGNPLVDPLIVWQVEDDQIISVGTDGVVTALAEGTTTVIANIQGVTGEATVEVLEVPVDRVEIQPADPTIAIGAEVQLEATPYGIDDSELSGREVTWTTSDAAIASVDQNGFVAGEAEGTATITAEVEGVTADVTVTVVSGNSPPTATNHTVTVSEDTAVAIDLEGNDPDGDALTFAVASGPSNGTLGTLDTATGEVTYTPNADYFGADEFTFTVNDGEDISAEATVTINVSSVNDGPTAADDSANTDEDAPVTVDVLSNDSDPEGDNLTVSITSQPSDGTASVTSNQIEYSPAQDFNGSDSLEYTVSDGNGGTATATLTIQIAAVNDAPVASDDTAGTNENQSTNIDVLANDADADGDNLTVTGTTTSAQGVTVNVETDNTITYQPPTDYVGMDTFDYTLSDGVITDTATVTVTVNNVNDAPTAADDSATTDEDVAVTIDVLANDGDPDNDTLTIDSATSPSKGTASISGGQITYTPGAEESGTDTFDYTITDGSLTATATVTVTINAVDDPPVATDDSATTNEDTAVSVDVLANDTDVDTTTLSIASVTTPSKGAAAIDDAGTPGDTSDDTVTYTPNADANGIDSFDYTVSDGTSTATATVSVSVNAVNDAPTATDDTATASVSATVTIDVLSNDTDVDSSDTLSVTAIDTSSTDGTVVDNGDGTFDYTAPGTAGTDAFVYTVSDGNGGTDTATVTITVQ